MQNSFDIHILYTYVCQMPNSTFIFTYSCIEDIRIYICPCISTLNYDPLIILYISFVKEFWMRAVKSNLGKYIFFLIKSY